LLRCVGAALSVLTLTCQGCAYTYIDADGNRHAIGLLDVTVHAPASPATFAGDVLETTTIGVTVGQTAQGGYVAVGFNRQTTAALRDNALVLGNPVALLTRPKHEQQGDAR